MTDHLESKIVKVLNEYPISPHALFETVIPVSLGIRRASIMYMDQLNLRMIRSSRKWNEESVPRMLKQMARQEFGIGMHEFPDPSVLIYGLPAEMSKRYVFFKEDSVLMDFHRMKAQYGTIASKGEFGIMDTEVISPLLQKEGELLGVPQCCIDVYKADRVKCHTTQVQDHTPENRFRREFIEKVPTLDELKQFDRSRIAQFWAYEIYPCHLDCPEALAMGQRMLGIYNEKLATIVQGLMLNNAIRIHSPSEWNKFAPKRVSDAKYDNWNLPVFKELGIRVRNY